MGLPRSDKYTRDRFRRFILAAGENRCNRCGFTDVRALQIDHVNGGGTKDTKSQRNGAFYKRVLASMVAGEGKYQILCANCNWIKRAENKEYPNSLTGEFE